MARGGLDLGETDIGAGIDDLAMEIGHLHRVGIDQAEAREALRPSNRQRGRDAESADADDQNGFVFAHCSR